MTSGQGLLLKAKYGSLTLLQPEFVFLSQALVAITDIADDWDLGHHLGTWCCVWTWVHTYLSDLHCQPWPCMAA